MNNNESVNTNEKLDLKKKIKYLSSIRHEIKKNRILFDESKDRFGLDELSQLIKVKNTSEIKGYPFKGITSKYNKISQGINFGLKIVPIETKYDKKEHPCNLENIILKELTDNIINKNISPHFTYYLGLQKVKNKSRALKMLNLKRLEVENKIRTHSNLLISEFVEGGSLDNWVFNTYEADKEISDDQWKILVFQLIYTIAIIQHYYKMMHNDFHYGNILIDDSIKSDGYLVYEINNKKYYVKNTGVIPKLFDFEFGMSYSDKIKECYPNKFIIGPYEYDNKLHKTIINEEKIRQNKINKMLSWQNSSSTNSDSDSDDFNVPYNYNEVYDIHYFLTSLLDLYISQELFDWIIDLYPRELIPEDETSSNDTSEESEESEDDDTSSTNEESEDDDTSSTNEKSDTSSTNEETDTSETISDLSSKTEESSSNNLNNIHLHKGRLINGTENIFNLPSPITLLNHNFFKKFTIKPADFDESKAIYFKAGF